jgi:hypothetical protein
LCGVAINTTPAVDSIMAPSLGFCSFLRYSEDLISALDTLDQ